MCTEVAWTFVRQADLLWLLHIEQQASHRRIAKIIIKAVVGRGYLYVQHDIV